MNTKKEKSHSVLAHENDLNFDIDVCSMSDCNTVLSDLQDEVFNKFQPKKISSEILAGVYSELDLNSRYERVSECGSYLEFRVTSKEKKLNTANFCKDRLCPMCNWRRSLKIYSQVSSVMDELEKQGYRFLFLTLTVKNCSADDLEKTVQVLYDGWRYLYNKSKVFRKCVKGSFRALEVTRNKESGEFHPHLHVILAVLPSYFGKDYLSQGAWADLWRSACDLDYNPIIDIRTIKKGSKGLSGAVAEVSKYAVKSADFLNGSMVQKMAYVSAFLNALSKRRLCSFTGCFAEVRKQLSLDDVENGDLVHLDNDSIREDIAFMIVRYSWKSGVYVQL